MRIYSWNVNGLRACIRKGFLDWLDESNGDIIALQEVRARRKQLPKKARKMDDWNVHIVAGEKKGYSGVGLYSRQAWDDISTELGVEEHDREGRLQFARFGELLLVNGYFPNGSGKNRDHSRIPFKLDFYQRLFDLLQPKLEAGEKILVAGDMNTAHQPIDLARPKANHNKTSGFCDNEREEITRWLDAGWVDTFRAFDDTGENYTWWTYRGGARKRNVGWRIDYIFASPAAMEYVRDASIHSEIMGSDHCPISVDVDPEIMK
jgi:exodeoxyribonuclease-3